MFTVPPALNIQMTHAQKCNVVGLLKTILHIFNFFIFGFTQHSPIKNPIWPWSHKVWRSLENKNKETALMRMCIL